MIQIRTMKLCTPILIASLSTTTGGSISDGYAVSLLEEGGRIFFEA
jgi:hypothetical protein